MHLPAELIQDILRGELTALVWTTYDSDTEDYIPADTSISPELIAKLTDELSAPLDNTHYIDIMQYLDRINPTDGDTPAAWLGHDLALTRNHHGAGFWDRNLGELGTSLTQWAHTFPELDTYLGDDNHLHA